MYRQLAPKSSLFGNFPRVVESPEAGAAERAGLAVDDPAQLAPLAALHARAGHGRLLGSAYTRPSIMSRASLYEQFGQMRYRLGSGLSHVRLQRRQRQRRAEVARRWWKAPR